MCGLGVKTSSIAAAGCFLDCGPLDHYRSDGRRTAEEGVPDAGNSHPDSLGEVGPIKSRNRGMKTSDGLMLPTFLVLGELPAWGCTGAISSFARQPALNVSPRSDMNQYSLSDERRGRGRREATSVTLPCQL